MVTTRTTALQPVVADLRTVFGDRLEAVVGYGWRPQTQAPSLALVQTLTVDDLEACAARVGAWHRAGAATPLIITRHDFARSLDAFPVEFGEIIASHEVAYGRDPFEGLAIRPDDLRRACEIQARSHLLHLREDYMESGGRPADIDALVRESAPGVAALLRQLARLDGVAADQPGDLARYATGRVGLDGHVVGDLLALSNADTMTSVDSIKLFPAYLTTLERLADFIDRWRAA